MPVRQPQIPHFYMRGTGNFFFKKKNLAFLFLFFFFFVWRVGLFFFFYKKNFLRVTNTVCPIFFFSSLSFFFFFQKSLGLPHLFFQHTFVYSPLSFFPVLMLYPKTKKRKRSTLLAPLGSLKIKNSRVHTTATISVVLFFFLRLQKKKELSPLFTCTLTCPERKKEAHLFRCPGIVE